MPTLTLRLVLSGHLHSYKRVREERELRRELGVTRAKNKASGSTERNYLVPALA